jgi:hypothetical protein
MFILSTGRRLFGCFHFLAIVSKVPMNMSEYSLVECKHAISGGRSLRGTLQNAPETWEVRDSQDSKGGTLDKMPDSGKRELTDPTSIRKADEGWGCHPTVTPLTHNCFCLKEIQGWKWRGA